MAISSEEAQAVSGAALEALGMPLSNGQADAVTRAAPASVQEAAAGAAWTAPHVLNDLTDWLRGDASTKAISKIMCSIP